MNRLRSKLTYSNVISTLCLFLLVGGGTAVAANHLGKNSVGSKQLKKNAVTAAKLKAGVVVSAKLAEDAVNSSKIAPGAVSGSKLAPGAVGSSNLAAGAVTGDKLAPGAVTGDKINVGTLPTVPDSATTEVVKGSHTTLHVGQEAPIFTYGPFTITAQCTEIEEAKRTALSTLALLEERFVISSSTPNSVFASRFDGGKDLGPETPTAARIVGESGSRKNQDSYQYLSPAENTVSASSIGGQAFNASIGLATDEDSGTCWSWLNADVIG